MDIYTIGEEKCIDGTWGRLVGKRFYTHTTELDGELFLARALDVDSIFKTYVGLLDTVDNKVLIENVVHNNLIHWYQREPVKHKRGDVVKVKGSISKYMTTPFFIRDGASLPSPQRTQSEVFTNPPMNIE